MKKTEFLIVNKNNLHFIQLTTTIIVYQLYSFMTKNYNVLDLFCGCGGMTKGLEDAGLNIIAGIDIWNKAIASYTQNYKHQGICEDITKLSPEQFQQQYNKNNTKIEKNKQNDKVVLFVFNNFYQIINQTSAAFGC